MWLSISFGAASMAPLSFFTIYGRKDNKVFFYLSRPCVPYINNRTNSTSAFFGSLIVLREYLSSSRKDHFIYVFLCFPALPAAPATAFGGGGGFHAKRYLAACLT